MIALIAALTAALVAVLLIPDRPFAPSAGMSYLASQAHGGPRTLLGRLEAGQRSLLQGTGIAISPRALLLVTLAVAGGAGALVTPLLGLFSGILAAASVVLFIREAMISLRERRTLQFSLQFREALVSLTSSLRAGQSLASALETALHDLRRLLGSQSAPVIEQLQQVVEEVRLGVSVDHALQHFKERMPLEEVAQFVDAAVITRNKGGNLTEVMTGVARLITDKLAVRQEVQVLTAEKRAEGLVISLLPVVVLLLATTLNPDYMAPLTATFWGQALVGLGLFAVVCSYLIARAVTRIEV